MCTSYYPIATEQIAGWTLVFYTLSVTTRRMSLVDCVGSHHREKGVNPSKSKHTWVKFYKGCPVTLKRPSKTNPLPQAQEIQVTQSKKLPWLCVLLWALVVCEWLWLRENNWPHVPHNPSSENPQNHNTKTLLSQNFHNTKSGLWRAIDQLVNLPYTPLQLGTFKLK